MHTFIRCSKHIDNQLQLNRSLRLLLCMSCSEVRLGARGSRWSASRCQERCFEHFPSVVIDGWNRIIYGCLTEWFTNLIIHKTSKMWNGETRAKWICTRDGSIKISADKSCLPVLGNVALSEGRQLAAHPLLTPGVKINQLLNSWACSFPWGALPEKHLL